MFKSAIKGLENIFETEIPQGSIILLRGPAGSLKSSLAFSMIAGSFSNPIEHALYATLEQSKESHLRNMSGFGMTATCQIHIFDYRDLRIEWEDRDVDLVRETVEVIDYYREKFGTQSKRHRELR